MGAERRPQRAGREEGKGPQGKTASGLGGAAQGGEECGAAEREHAGLDWSAGGPQRQCRPWRARTCRWKDTSTSGRKVEMARHQR